MVVSTPTRRKHMNIQLKVKIIEICGSQSDFAQKIGVHESTISRVIRGRKSLSPEEIEVWSKALRCDKRILEAAR